MSGLGKEKWGFLVSVVFGILLTVLAIPDELRPYLSWLFLLLFICTSIAWLVSTFPKFAKLRSSPKALSHMTLLIVGSVGAIVSIIAWKLVSPGAQNTVSEIKSPSFALSEELFKVEIGGNVQQITRKSLEAGPVPERILGLPVSFALLNNHLVVDADANGVKVRQNKILVGVEKNDVNHNPDWSVVEIVNASALPVLQLIYKQHTNLELRGIFQKEKGVIICGDTVAMHKVLTDEKIAQTGLRPLFKYPAWKHKGEFAETATGPTGFIKSDVRLENPGNFDAEGNYNVYVELKNMGPAFAIAPEMFIAIPTSKPEKHLWQVKETHQRLRHD